MSKKIVATHQQLSEQHKTVVGTEEELKLNITGGNEPTSTAVVDPSLRTSQSKSNKGGTASAAKA